MFKKIFIIFFLAIVLSLSLATAVLATKYGLDGAAREAGLSTQSLAMMIGNVIGAALSLVGVIFFALMIFGGFLWMTAHGKEEQAKQGMDTVIAAVIGLIIILAAYAITNFVLSNVGGVDSKLSTNNNSSCAEVEELLRLDFSCLPEEECDEETINNDSGLCTDGKVCCRKKAASSGTGSVFAECVYDSNKITEPLPIETECFNKGTDKQNCEQTTGCKFDGNNCWADYDILREECKKQSSGTQCEGLTYCTPVYQEE